MSQKLSTVVPLNPKPWLRKWENLQTHLDGYRFHWMHNRDSILHFFSQPTWRLVLHARISQKNSKVHWSHLRKYWLIVMRQDILWEHCCLASANPGVWPHEGLQVSASAHQCTLADIKHCLRLTRLSSPHQGNCTWGGAREDMGRGKICPWCLFSSSCTIYRLVDD